MAFDRQNIWVLGDGGTLLAGDGELWTPVDAGVTQNLNDALVTGAGEMWVAGDRGTLLHYQDGLWQAEATGTFVDLKSIAADGQDGFWLAGAGGSLLHWSPAGPGTPTPEPTATASPPPSATPSPSASPTTVASATPTPEPSPPPGPWYDLVLADDDLAAGEEFRLDRSCGNPGPLPLAVDEYIILDVFGAYWFHPGWSQTVDLVSWTAGAGSSAAETVLEFVWPAGAGNLAGLRFWGAWLAAGSTEQLLAMDMVEWGFHD